jgi:hypothetical protein
MLFKRNPDMETKIVRIQTFECWCQKRYRVECSESDIHTDFKCSCGSVKILQGAVLKAQRIETHFRPIFTSKHFLRLDSRLCWQCGKEIFVLRREKTSPGYLSVKCDCGGKSPVEDGILAAFHREELTKECGASTK